MVDVNVLSCTSRSTSRPLALHRSLISGENLKGIKQTEFKRVQIKIERKSCLCSLINSKKIKHISKKILDEKQLRNYTVQKSSAGQALIFLRFSFWRIFSRTLHCISYSSFAGNHSSFNLYVCCERISIYLKPSLLTLQVRNGMALVRPPGHHATREEVCGNCFFNNVALAATHALNNLGLERYVTLVMNRRAFYKTHVLIFWVRNLFYLCIIVPRNVTPLSRNSPLLCTLRAWH